MFEDGAPKTREVDQLSADVEALCCDWRRMRAVVERIAGAPWWDLHTLSCQYCHAPFEVSIGECQHELDCIYNRCCEIVGTKPLPLPDQSVLAEWNKQASTTWSLGD
jgi:hypothetical protein